MLLPSMLGPDLGVLYEVQVSPPHGDGCVPTDQGERRRVKTGKGIAMTLEHKDDDDDSQSG